MLGAFARAAPQALFIAVLAAITARATEPMTNYALNSTSASQSDPLISGLSAASDPPNFLLVGVIALVLTLIGRAMVEAEL